MNQTMLDIVRMADRLQNSGIDLSRVCYLVSAAEWEELEVAMYGLKHDARSKITRIMIGGINVRQHEAPATRAVAGEITGLQEGK